MIVMLRCGCAAMATHSNPHDGLPAGHPSCVIHAGIDAGACVVVPSPDFSARRARCFWYGKPPRKSECNYGAKWNEPACQCEQPSGTTLPFFVSTPTKEYDEFYCGCHSWD